MATPTLVVDSHGQDLSGHLYAQFLGRALETVGDARGRGSLDDLQFVLPQESTVAEQRRRVSRRRGATGVAVLRRELDGRVHTVNLAAESGRLEESSIKHGSYML